MLNENESFSEKPKPLEMRHYLNISTPFHPFTVMRKRIKRKPITIGKSIRILLKIKTGKSYQNAILTDTAFGEGGEKQILYKVVSFRGRYAHVSIVRQLDVAVCRAVNGGTRSAGVGRHPRTICHC